MPHPSSLSSQTPRVIIASGMQGTGVSTIAELLRRSTSSLIVVDGGATWADIAEACMPGFTKLIAVTTHDIISITSTYALVKLVRDRFPDAPIEVLVNYSDTREALKTYERVQSAASHFLNETIGYAGAIPAHPLSATDDHVGALLGHDAVLAIHDLAFRLDEESSVMHDHTAARAIERRVIQ